MNKKIIVLLVIGISLFLLLGTSISYSMWIYNHEQAIANVVDQACFNMNIVNDSNNLSFEVDFPRTIEDGMKREAYEFSIENTCDIDAAYEILVEVVEGSTLSPEFARVAIDDSSFLLSKLKKSRDNYILKTGYLEPNEVKTFEYRFWIDYDATNDDVLNKTFSTKLVIKTLPEKVPYSEGILSGADPVINDGIIPVIIQDNGDVVIADIYEEWYNYENKDWANMVLVSREFYRKADPGTVIPMDEISQMYVWIPRYSYDAESIVDTDHAIDINFVSAGVASHPAFSVEGRELSGLWVGKFETALSFDVDNYLLSYSIKPNLINVGSLYLSDILSFPYIFNFHFGVNSSGETHLTKNTEWGAVAYLSQSIYGVCGSESDCEKIENNNYYNSSSYDVVTGCGGNDEANSVSSTGIDICPEENRWTTENGMHASTTRNITGIYDMAGGDNEILAGVMLSASGDFPMSLNDNITTPPNIVYYDAYPYSSSSNYFGKGLVGDATFELNPSGSVMSNWNDDSISFPYGTAGNNWVKRGGSASNGSSSGIWNIKGCLAGTYDDETYRFSFWNISLSGSGNL